ncbi:hypothetical protein [Streptomyces cacaoi]|uniref:Uncharacterized protein n=1 Tax=Streptomyces cacaoi TaxID=1898 RepID=A0A4Y3R0G1_STRCI|nr:hypothetical protein [Streptomyces cacaoi]GEB50407.1 hypothetical protein SCA03_29580 [Streptomyces cacaoi]
MIREFADFVATDMSTDDIVEVALTTVDASAPATRGDVAAATAELLALAIQTEDQQAEDLQDRLHGLHSAITSLEIRLAALERAVPRTTAA